MAVIPSATIPKPPNWLALPVNLPIDSSTCLAIASGTQAVMNSCSTALRSLENTGNALNKANITVANGTMAMVVVKVRLPAVRPSRSSRNRCRKVW